MDIPALVNKLPLDIRVEVKDALKVLRDSELFESIMMESKTEVLQAATVLAHDRNYEQIERVSIRTACLLETLTGLIEATRE